ncbi:CD63 antigen-like [Parasteatoda tepidariorum]|uniref:CD63 antigen-like n=1 Tax=Parasteatoda tepidariorum TaxID=114398 RepID=UPI00077F98B2|nr:CD63 antigen-like [Parasteatoda tepidariorum]
MNLGTKLIRYALIAINIIFVICGIGMITVGALGTRQDMTHFLGIKYISAPIICILVGCIIFVVAFFGCFGALKYNHVMVLVFALLVFVIIVLEIAGGICAYSYRVKTEAFLKKSMEESLSRNHNDTLKIWDALQSHLECCGTNGPADYRKHNFTVPRSCCKTSASNATCVEADAFQDGCYLKVSEVFSRHVIAIFAVAIGFAIVELLIFMSSLLLAHEIKKENEALN